MNYNDTGVGLLGLNSHTNNEEGAIGAERTRRSANGANPGSIPVPMRVAVSAMGDEP